MHINAQRSINMVKRKRTRDQTQIVHKYFLMICGILKTVYSKKEFEYLREKLVHSVVWQQMSKK